jgi:hypothetical protein
MRFSAIPAVFLLGAVTACELPTARHTSKPVEMVESGWVITCSDKSEPTSSAHGLPFMLFQTHIGGHFDTFTFSSNNVPKCETWQKRDVDELFKQGSAKRDYEITVVQHMNAHDDFDGTWDLLKMRSLASSQ